MIYLCIHFVLPQLTESIVGIVNQIPHYMEIASKMTQDIIKDFDISDQMATFLNDKLMKFQQD